jgi:hypothetical protein
LEQWKIRARIRLVTQRFTIEDLVAQNEWGVVYRAIDTETGQTVGIRRFFPFGHDGGGLDSEEQIAYAIAIERLAGIRHAAMRSIIWGGCDPVDQMPCIVTEWIEGFSLGGYTEHAPLKHADAIQILTHALEVCEVLSELFAEEAVWIETDLESIIVGQEGSGRGATFWISPLRWLGSEKHKGGMGAIIQLTEEIMHWQGVLIPNEAGGGLGAWLKWLRQESESMTLHQAREMLSAAIGMEPPPSPTKLVQAATVPDKELKRAQKKGLSRMTLVMIATLILLIAVGVAWWLTRRGPSNAGAMLDRIQAAMIR